MIYPLNTNKIEKLDLDPIKKINGYIWFNTVEKVFKTYVDNKLEVFITDKNLETEIHAALLSKHEFSISFTEAYKIIITHNKNTKIFSYNLFDTLENCSLSVSMNIINENEVSIDFIDPVTGYIFMYFE